MRVFVTVGNAAQPFDRLLRGVDRALDDLPGSWSGVCQYGWSGVRPKGLVGVAFLDRDGFAAEIRAADVVICHGGVGTLSTAIRSGHHPLVMPRLRRHGEIVNDHQLEIVAELVQRSLARCVTDELELRRALLSLGPSGTRRGEAEAGQDPGDRLHPLRDDLRSAAGLGRPRPWAGAILRLLAMGAPKIMPVVRPRGRGGTSRPERDDRG